MALMHLYMNNPTAGGTDGTEVSSGTESAPITITLDASRAESKAAKCAVRCDATYSLEGGAAIQLNRPRGNHILIGAVKTLSVSNWRIIPDDRQRKIETIGGIVVEDFGHVSAGDKFSCRVTLDAAGANAVRNYWHNRIFVNVTDEAGRILDNLRVKVKNYGYIPHFPNYFSATLEFWKE